MRSRVTSERGAINRTFWLFVIVFIIFGVVLIDGGSIIFSSLQLSELGDEAATKGAVVFRDTKNLTQVKTAIEATIEERDEDVVLVDKSLEVGQDGTITFVLRKQAKTLVVHRIGPLQDLAQLEVKPSAGASGV